MWRLEQNSRTIPRKHDEFQPLCLLDSRRFVFSQEKSITLRIRQWLHSTWSLLILCRMLRWFDSFNFASNIECESWRGNCSVSSWLGTRYQESIPQPLGLILGPIKDALDWSPGRSDPGPYLFALSADRKFTTVGRLRVYNLFLKGAASGLLLMVFRFIYRLEGEPFSPGSLIR